MASTYTNNFELEKQGVGDNVGTWGDPTLNQNVIDRIDAAMGKTTTVALVSSNVTLTQTQWRTKCLKLTGTISANINILLPLSINDGGGLTLAVGGEFIVDNQTSGAFTITVKTAATASTGVEVPQGFRSTLYSDTANVTYADDQARSTVQTYAGNPNGSVAGTAGSSTTPASVRYDRTNGIWYVCTTSGTTSTAVWTAINGAVTLPQGYLTPSSSADNVILTGDSVGATRLYYTPYAGNSVPIFNGTAFVPYSISQMTLDLTASQAASGIYDAVLFLNTSGVPTIGLSPSWSSGTGGSVLAGSCARGTGVGGAAIQRVGGLWLNTAAMTLNNGATTYSIAAQRGTAVASVFVDSTQGQVSCYRTFGQSRKWGVWNFYNRQPISLRAGDGTGGTFANTTYAALLATAANSLTVFAGLAEEEFSFKAGLSFAALSSIVAVNVGVGYNSTTTISGTAINGPRASGITLGGASAYYDAPPALGIQLITLLAKTDSSTITVTAGEANNSLVAKWNA